VRRQLERNGLDASEVELTDGALKVIVGDYTREAGVRNLEREIGKLLRKVATKVAAGTGAGSAGEVGEGEPLPEEAAQNEPSSEPGAPGEAADTPGEAATVTKIVIDAPDVRGYLGRQKFFFEAAERTSVPGVATGLAVTGTGGDVLFIEATRTDTEDHPGNGLTLTGQLGDVMKESVQIALSFVRSHAEQLGIPTQSLKGAFHVHVPAGAVPKDGPSAGITMTTALASLLTGRPVRSTVGMTGEVTLQGRVLPIGGLKQKVLAAHRAGLKEVILPKRNEGDLEDVPEQVREEMQFHPVETIDEVLRLALEPSNGPAEQVA
jgi:ATP-dependent Lon protease